MSPSGLTDAERDRLRALEGTRSLADVVDVTGIADEHDAYFSAKTEHRRLRRRALPTAQPSVGLPGISLDVGGSTFHIHGITHADTTAEREFVRDHVRNYRNAGAAVYCEQGIRRLYFDDFDGVCEMDDYRWAMEQCRALGIDSSVSDIIGPDFDGVSERLQAVADRFRTNVFELIETGRDQYGDAFAETMGDVASSFLVSHTGHAMGDDFESFRATQRAATDPSKLIDLQQYYEAAFLPQPVEREWIARHDPELELFTHARNERMADYGVAHADGVSDFHLIVGAAHGPGVAYYLRRHRDGDRDSADFEYT